MITKINQLKNQTNSNKIKTICETAIGMLSSVIYNNVTPEAKYEIERVAMETLFENLQAFKKDIIVKEWLNNVTRIYAVQNIGVRKAINILEQSEAKYNPTLHEILLQYKNMLSEVPEILIYESFLPALSSFGYLPTVQQQIDYIEDVVKKYNIDIEINKVIEAMKTSRSNYLLPLIEDIVESYLTNKTEQTKHYLKETLIKFSYDDYVRSIINLVNADMTNLQLEYANSFCDIQKIYSPLYYLGENEVIFNIKGKYFIKKGNNVSKLSREYVPNLNEDFVSLCEVINNPNIFVKDNNNIEVYYDKDTAIINKNGITVNEEFLSEDKLEESLKVAPIIGNTEFYSIVKTLFENFNEFAEIDFVKRVSLRENVNYAADIFKLRDNIFISTYDPINNKETFYKNVNPIQAKNIMMEHLRYDVSKVFEDVLPSEQKILAEIEQTKEEYSNYILLIEEKINSLQNQINTQTKQEIINILEEELYEIKEEYKDYLNEVEKYIRPLGENDELTENVTITVDVNGKKYIVPIPQEAGETDSEDSLSANYTNDEPATEVTFNDDESELLGDSPSIQGDEVDIDQEKIADEINTIEKEKEEEGEEKEPGDEEKAGTEVTSDDEENKEAEDEETEETDSEGNIIKKKEKKPLKKESFIRETNKTKKVYLKKKLTESLNKQSNVLNESFPNITDNVMYKNQKASIIGQMSNGDYIVQLSRSGSTEYAKPNEVKIIGAKVETLKPPFKFDEKTQKLLFEQYVKCGIYMGNTPIKLTNCYVKYSDWTNVPKDKLINVLVEGELNMLPREQVNILENPNDFANPSNYIQGVLVDESGIALKNVLINAIDYVEGIGDASMVRVLDINTNELTSYPKGSLKTLAV